MSTEQSDAIVGRLFRESRETEQEIALLSAQIREYASALSRAATELNGPSVTLGQRAVEAIPPQADILECLSQLEAAQRKLREVKASLTAITGA